jgi:hypothetical protein
MAGEAEPHIARAEETGPHVAWSKATGSCVAQADDEGRECTNDGIVIEETVEVRRWGGSSKGKSSSSKTTCRDIMMRWVRR